MMRHTYIYNIESLTCMFVYVLKFWSVCMYIYIYDIYILMYRRIDMYIQRERERAGRKACPSKRDRCPWWDMFLGLQRRPGLFDCRVCFSWPIKASTLSLGQEPGWGMMVLGTRDRHVSSNYSSQGRHTNVWRGRWGDSMKNFFTNLMKKTWTGQKTTTAPNWLF